MAKLKLQKREILGKKVKRVRQEGKVPGILYGHNLNSTPVMVNKKDLYQVMEEVGGSSLIDVELEKEGTFKVFIYDWQTDPLTGEILHVDFYSPKLSEKVEVEVPLELKGEAPAVKKGGTLLVFLEEVTVKALPDKVPHHITVDLSLLEEIDQEIKIQDLVVPEGVEVLHEPDEVVAKVIPPQREGGEEEEEAEGEVSSQEPSSSESS